MKKSLYTTAVAILLAGFTLTGCSDFLEAENKSAGGTSSDEYFASNPTSLLTSAFISLKNYSNQYDITDQGTDLYMNTRGVTPGAFNEYASLDEENSVVKSYYVNCFGTINYANGFLYYTEGNDSYAKQRQQARFLRAYAYYCLSQQFGGVPYITTYINTAEREYPRTNLNDLYKNITDDLLDIYNNSLLDATDYTSGAPSKEAVAALLAKIYLAWGWDVDTQLTDAARGTYTKTSTEHFSQAAQWAETAIGGTSLTQPFATKWSPSNENNSEFIWSIQYDATSIESSLADECNSQSGSYGGYYGTNQKGCDSRNQQSEKSMYLFEKGDTRYDATFMSTFYQGDTPDDAYFAVYNLSESQLANHAINLKFFPYWVTEAEADAWLAAHKSQMVKGNYPNAVKAAILTSPTVIKYEFDENGTPEKKSISLSSFNGATENGVCVRKFDDPVNKSYCFRDIVLIDRSELYLVAAEANLMTDNTSGFWKYINYVRTRANAQNINSIGDYNPQYSYPSTFGEITMLDLLLDERARECYAQKTRFVDLRRTKQLVRYNLAFNSAVSTIANMTGVDGEIKWLRPIPSAEMNNNNAMTAADQNPGYRSSSADEEEKNEP